MPILYRSSGAVLLVLQLSGCGGRDTASVPGEAVVAGGVVDVRRELVLDRIIVGATNASTGFGGVSHVAVDRSGGVVIEDPVGRNVIRVWPDGEFRDSLGRHGQGPGEYRYPYGVAVLTDGSIAIRDNEPPGIVLFDSLGAFVREWTLLDRVATAAGLWVEMSAGASEDLLLKVPFEGAGGLYEVPEFGFVVMSSTGDVIDSLQPPNRLEKQRQVSGAFQPREHFLWHPEGFAVVGFSDRYRIELQRPGGTINIEWPFAPIPLSAEERKADATSAALQRARGARGLDERPRLPDYKPAYRRILIAETGEVWVFLHGPGKRWASRKMAEFELPLIREPLRVDVYDSQGRSLWRIEGDAGIEPQVVRGDTVWAVVTGEFEEEYVARYVVR